MDERHKYNVEQKKPDTKEYIVCFHLMHIQKMAKPYLEVINQENSNCCREVATKGNKRHFWGAAGIAGCMYACVKIH